MTIFDQAWSDLDAGAARSGMTADRLLDGYSLRLAVAARGQCPACGELHHPQRCPTIAALRDAPAGTNLRSLAACLEASRHVTT